ncbi:hypothetical protein [Streptomyces atratus]|uniref:hypothetical protein n=1 Tax=Streptomyces atratus TaxID=1893 RepID=UPI00364F1573
MAVFLFGLEGLGGVVGEDLSQFGEDAAKDFAGKFDDLEATVNEKSEQLVQDLATK